MGIYLALYAVSDATIERLHADPPLAWRILAPDEPEHEAKARAELRPRPGFIARVFGRGGAPEPEPSAPPLELQAGEGDLGPLGDFEKSWQGLHFLLTGTPWEGEFPHNFLLGGGRELDFRPGDSPLLTHGSAETRRIAVALAAVPDETFRARLDPARMMELEIYPEVWEDAEAREYLLEDMQRLREAVATVAARGYGLLVSVV